VDWHDIDLVESAAYNSIKLVEFAELWAIDLAAKSKATRGFSVPI
jgi:hypothetical protein